MNHSILGSSDTLSTTRFIRIILALRVVENDITRQRTNIEHEEYYYYRSEALIIRRKAEKSSLKVTI